MQYLCNGEKKRYFIGELILFSTLVYSAIIYTCIMFTKKENIFFSFTEENKQIK